MNLWRQVAIGGAWAHVTCGPLELVIGLAWGLPALAVFGALSTALGAWILRDARRGVRRWPKNAPGSRRTRADEEKDGR